VAAAAAGSTWKKVSGIITRSLQVMAVVVLCGALIGALYGASQAQAPDSNVGILPALCVHNVNLTRFAQSMGWEEYRPPDFIFWENDLYPECRYLFPIWRRTPQGMSSQQHSTQLQGPSKYPNVEMEIEMFLFCFPDIRKQASTK
jgi:hypothetical protein